MSQYVSIPPNDILPNLYQSWSVKVGYISFFWSSGKQQSYNFVGFHVTGIKGALSSLIELLITKSPLKIMKNSFYFVLKALLFLKIFKFLSWFFGIVKKRLDQKDQVIFKTYVVTTWLTNNCNTHIDQYLKK